RTKSRAARVLEVAGIWTLAVAYRVRWGIVRDRVSGWICGTGAPSGDHVLEVDTSTRPDIPVNTASIERDGSLRVHVPFHDHASVTHTARAVRGTDVAS